MYFAHECYALQALQKKNYIHYGGFNCDENFAFGQFISIPYSLVAVCLFNFFGCSEP